MSQRWIDRGSLLSYFILTALPLALGLGYALAYSLGLTGLVNEGFTLRHWGEVLFGNLFWLSLLFSAWVAFASMALAITGALSAVLLWRQKLVKGLMSYLFYIPLTLPAVVVAFFFFQLLSRGGLLARLAWKTGLTGEMDAFPELVNDPYGLGIIIAHAFMALPFFCLLFSNLYQTERLATYSAVAAGLGASPKQIGRRVIIPLLLKRSWPTLALYYLFVLSSYEVPLLLGSRSREMVSVLTIQKLQRFNLLDIPQAYAISVLYSIIVLAFIIGLLSLGGLAFAKK